MGFGLWARGSLTVKAFAELPFAVADISRKWVCGICSQSKTGSAESAQNTKHVLSAYFCVDLRETMDSACGEIFLFWPIRRTLGALSFSQISQKIADGFWVMGKREFNCQGLRRTAFCSSRYFTEMGLRDLFPVKDWVCGIGPKHKTRAIWVFLRGSARNYGFRLRRNIFILAHSADSRGFEFLADFAENRRWVLGYGQEGV